MEIEIEFYTTSRGGCPFDDWFEDIRDLQTRTKILARMGRLRLGNFGDCKSVGDGVSELRIDHGPGIRMYYSKVGSKVILLLCGGTKRTQDRDLQTAKEYFKEYHWRKEDR